MNKRQTIFIQMLVPLLIGIGFISNAAAQPSDAALKKQLTHAKTVSVTSNTCVRVSATRSDRGPTRGE